MSVSLVRELSVAREAASEAATVLCRHYNAERVEIRHKSDASPVTAADLAANEAIVARLREAFPDDGILSEESTDEQARLRKQRVWIVDPMDGTRDFLARTGHFAVHVALAIDGIVAVAAVAVPATNIIYFADDSGAYAQEAGGEIMELQVSAATTHMRVGISAQISDPRLLALARRDSIELHRIGASIKMLQVAAGTLEASLCLTGSEHEWDTAAPGKIVTAAGGMVTDTLGNPFRYNRADVKHHDGIIMSNGHVHDAMLRIAAENRSSSR